jgi:chloramphenicol O-acetyltransferase type A
MKTKDIGSWNRKEHFRFFRTFQEPFFGITANVDCTHTYDHCRNSGRSFFLAYHHAAITAVNSIEEFRYRIQGEAVVMAERVHPMTTIGREDHTFAFTFLPFHDDFDTFARTAQEAIAVVRSGSGLIVHEFPDRLDVVHCTALPWIRFTGITHARDYKPGDSIPKIAFGKCVEENGRMMMPVSVHVHHGLMDGYHVGQFFESFETILQSKI